MGNRIVFVGDEVSAAGYRIAGLDTRVPGSGEETSVLQEELARAALVLVAAAVARRVEPAVLRRAQGAVTPLMLVVPEDGGAMPSEIVSRVRVQLGVAEA